MSPTLRVLVALIVGLALGILVSLTGSPMLVRIATGIEPIGTLFINAIRMTVIPLVVASLVVGVGQARDPRSVGRVGIGAVVLFVVLLAIGVTFAMLVTPPLLALIPLTPEATAALREGAASTAGAARDTAAKLPGFAQWMVDLVPVNPVKAAADGAMLPLIVFAVAFGLAVSKLPDERRAALLDVTRAVAAASVTLVEWVLALASYVAITAVAMTTFAIVVLYPAAVLLGRMRPGAFARAALPAQAVAFSGRSSLASLPAMMEASRARLQLPETITSFFLPLAASTFRVGGSVGQTIALLFIARLYGVTLSPTELVMVGAALLVMTFSIPGVPAGSIIALVPVLVAAGLPVEGVGLVLGVDTIPDMFRTTTNVTGDLVAATILGRGRRA